MKALDDESQLVITACNGSIEAFETLVLRYEPRIRRLLYSLTRREESLTQDLCQKTFLQAYHTLPHLQGDLAPWLYGIALDQVRESKHVRWVPFSSPQDSEEEAFVQLNSHLDDLVAQVGQREAIPFVLACLPIALVACLLLDAEGFSCREIADILQVSPAAVRSCLTHARQMFQRLALDDLSARQVGPQKTRLPAARHRVPSPVARGQNDNRRAAAAPVYP
jgi:RNA polymerase sigma-70 factor (ECF subfamily)